MTVRSVTSPYSVVVTIAVIEIWRSAVAPLGIVVVNEAVPALEVVRVDDAIGGTPGTVIVNVTAAPARGLPSGSLTFTEIVTGSGSLEIEVLFSSNPTVTGASVTSGFVRNDGKIGRAHV